MSKIGSRLGFYRRMAQVPQTANPKAGCPEYPLALAMAQTDHCMLDQADEKVRAAVPRRIESALSSPDKAAP
jgi:hypothetical protein